MEKSEQAVKLIDALFEQLEQGLITVSEYQAKIIEAIVTLEERDHE
jgi:hypothetical protein